MRFRHAFGFLFLLSSIVLPTFGQTRSSGQTALSINGNVRDEGDQRPMSNIRVDLKKPTGSLVDNTSTNANGDFEFVGVPNGNYVIEIEVKGYDPIRQSVEIGNAPRSGVSISMAQSAIIVNPSSTVTISAHQLSVPHKAYDEYEKGAELLYGKADYQGAIAEFERAIKDFPNYYEAYADIGNAYLRLRQMVPAEEALRKSVQLSSGRYAEALIMLSDLLSNMNRYQEAVTFARKVMDIDSSSWHSAFELARALSGLKQVEEAEKSAIQARDLNPDNAPIYLLLANIHIQKQDYPALLQDIDSFLRLEPAGPDADQARKLRDDLEARKQLAEQQAKDDETGRSVGDAASSAGGKEVSPLAPDTSGLPSLPPPSQSNP